MIPGAGFSIGLVSDVFIGNILGFELDKVRELADSKGVNIRCFPNVAQAAWNGANPITKFFIRPEDALFYSDYIDSFELFDIGQNIPLLFQLYKYDKSWGGDLREIITYFNEYVDNRLIDGQWAKSRYKCGKKCAKGENCNICHRIVEMSETMSEKEIQMHHFLTKEIY